MKTIICDKCGVSEIDLKQKYKYKCNINKNNYEQYKKLIRFRTIDFDYNLCYKCWLEYTKIVKNFIETKE